MRNISKQLAAPGRTVRASTTGRWEERESMAQK